MTVEAHPVGVRCNLSCTYCYENPVRLHEGPVHADIDKMLKTLDGRGFTVFGGEPLLTPLADLEKLFANGADGIQTNGTMITARHIELFKKYNIHVGISVDGPDEMNDARRIGGLESTRRATATTHASIKKLLEEGVQTSLIITLHKLNISEERRPRFKRWLSYLDSIGMKNARFHLLENDGADDLRLTDEESEVAVLDLLQFVQTLNTLKVDLFDEMERSLLGEGNVSCIWNGCDPYTTPAVQAVDADGSLTNCFRTFKDGVAYRKSDHPGNERLLALAQTPQELGGCKDCRYFAACKGECPGTGLDGDWRNRTEHCRTLKVIFGFIEEKIEAAGKKVQPPTVFIDHIIKDGHDDCHGDSHEDTPHIDRVDFGIIPVVKA